MVDPGHHFLDNFYRRRRSFNDVDGIATTHFHDDHFADFPSLLALIHQCSRNETMRLRQFDLFLDKETDRSFREFYRRSTNFRYRDVLSHGRRTGAAAREIAEGIFLEALPAKHPSNVKGSCIGLLITLERRETQIFVTGDTGWDASLAEAYVKKKRAKRCILVAHVSSTYPAEMRSAMAGKPEFYSKHLCIHGLAKMIECLNPHTVILSEIGEELAPVIQDLAKLVENRYGTRCVVGFDGAIEWV